MTVEMRTLMIVPKIAADEYTAGARQKVAADKEMSASSREAGAAIQQTDAKISQAGDVLSRLSRTYVDGSRQAQTFEKDLRALNRELETGKTDIAAATTILVGMNQKLGVTGDASALAAKGQLQLAAAVRAANDQIKGQAASLSHAAGAYQAHIAQLRAIQDAESLRSAGAANQNRINAVLGVRDPLSSARDSAAIFEAEARRQQDIARMRSEQTGALFAQDLNGRFGIGSEVASARASASVFEEAGREADRLAGRVAALRAELNPLAAAQNRVNAEIAEYVTMAARGEISAQELSQAQALARGRLAANQNTGMRGQQNFNSTNAAFQVQDAVMMAMMGQAPLATGLQQGPQLAMAMQQGGGVKALGAGILSLVSPTMLFTVGATAATAATIQWFMKGKDGAKTLEDALKAHSGTLTLLKDQYGALGEAAKSVGNVGGMAFTEATARNAQTLLEAQIREKMTPMLDTVGGVGWLQSLLGNGGGVEGLRNLSGDQKQFAGPMAALIESAKSGKTDLAGFNDQVERLFEQLVGSSENPDRLRATADAVLALGSNAFDVTGKFAPFEDAINRLRIEGASGLATFNSEVERIGRANGLQKLADEAIIAGKEIVDLADKAAELEKILQRIDREETRPGLSDRRDLSRYVGRRGIELQSENDQFAAEQQMARARTNAERLAAVEAQVRARARQDGDTGGGLQSRVDRALAAERNRQDIEARDSRLDRERGQARSIEAAQHELSLIGATVGETARLNYEFSEMARLKDEAARRGGIIDPDEARRVKDTADELGRLADIAARLNLNRDLRFERDQMFRSPQDQGIASRLRGTGLGMDSDEARQMREMERFLDAKTMFTGFFSTFRSAMIENGGDMGDALGKAVLSSLSSSMQKQLDDIFDRLGTAFASWLTGVRPGSGFAANMTAGDFFGARTAANSNVNAAMGHVGSTIDFMRAGSPALGNMSAYRDAIASIESAGSGGYAAIGPTHPKMGRALGRYQIMEANIGPWSEAALGNRIGADEFMKNPGLQDKIFDHRFGGYVDKYGFRGASQAWFAGEAGMKNMGARDVLGTSVGGYGDKAAAALAKLGNTAEGAVKGLTSFDGSLVDMAGKLSSPNGPLGGLFGTGLSNFQGFQDGRGGGLGGMLGYGGGAAPSGGGGGGGILGMILGFLPKLFGFADGTDNAPPGYAWVGERGPEIIKFRGGEQVVPNHKIGANQNTFAPVFQIDARGSTMTRAEFESIARAQSQQAVAIYHEGQAQGGFGTLQNRYQSQKAG